MANSESETRWIGTMRTRVRLSLSDLVGGLGAIPQVADVDRIGLGPGGVTFVRSGNSVTVAWGELVPAESQWKGMLVLRTRDGTPPRGGPWIVDAFQGREILTDPRWPGLECSRQLVAKLLT